MNWKTIRLALLLLLVVLNVGLCTYTVYLSRERYIVPEERIELLRKQYRRAGFILPDTIKKKQYPVNRLLFQKEDLEERADGFWNEQYEKSYMIGSKVIYTCGTEVLIIDRDTSSLHYKQNMPEYESASKDMEDEHLAIAFARILMQKEKLELISKQKGPEGSNIYTFCEKYDGQLIFSNGISVTVYRGVVIEAYMRQYRIQGYDEEKRYIYPVDEVLFGCLDALTESHGLETLELYYGYAVVQGKGTSYYGEPQILICHESGSNLMVNQCTVEYGILQYH